MGVGLVFCSVYKKSYIIYNRMTSKENVGLSSEGGGPAHNTEALGNHRCAPEGRGREHTKVRGHGAHGIVASMAAAAIDGSVFSTPLLSG